MIVATSDSTAVQSRAVEYHRASYVELASGVDRMMAWLLGIEWLGMAVLAFLRTPYTWQGADRHWNPHFLAAVLAGPAFIGPCIALALCYPGRSWTRHCVAVAQMLVSIVLIDVTGGRIETHFHLFGSLAFLAFYRDWRVLVTASAVATIDHIVRGLWWPQLIYGITTVSPYRWLEHVWWVVFEDFFLFLAIHKGIQESRELARGKSLLYEGAYHDVLTGLCNRRQLSESFAELIELNPSTPNAVMFVDLDRFKQVNDIHGHTIGDELLLQVATRLTSCLSKNATLSRIGGDEFIIVLHEATAAKATEIGSVLLHSITKPFSIEGLELLLSATVGVALYPEHGLDLSTLKERADQAMYAAKAAGRNQIQIYTEQDAGKKEELRELSRDLFEAQNKSQLHLDFQPMVGRDGELLRFETLLRWNHPKFGEVAPADFIPIAERSGLIIQIGDWVLLEACKHCHSWQKQYTSPIGVTVNVSALQFEHPGFLSRVESILRQTGLCPSFLTLELTETTLAANPGQIHEHLRRLRATGINVSLDDFGTGFSSLNFLAELPANTIKLDRSFVHHHLGERSSVIKSVIQMAHKMGLRVVAEGVESQMEQEWLLNLECDELQGNRFSRPLPAILVLQYLTERVAISRTHEKEAIAC